MGGQRLAKARFGMPNPTDSSCKGFITNVGQEYAAFVPFTTYTAISETYNAAYDKLFDSLEKTLGSKANNRRHSEKTGSYISRVNKSRTGSEQPSIA
jgi:hypothetical protein